MQCFLRGKKNASGAPSPLAASSAVKQICKVAATVILFFGSVFDNNYAPNQVSLLYAYVRVIFEGRQ